MIDIRKNLQLTKGVIPAITLTCAQLLREHILKSGMRFKDFEFDNFEINDIASISRILTHADPHTDEYMAMMIIRAALPDYKKLLPLEETYLSDAKDDTRAKLTWPNSILLGFGGSQNGGAQAGILFDEHESEETAGSVKESSATMLVKNKLLKGNLSAPLFHILREVDHLDANGGAASQNLHIYIKRYHSLDLFSGYDKDGNVINDRMDSVWKEASISACIISLIMAETDGLFFTSKSYWDQHIKDDVIQSLEFYKKHSSLKDDPEFLHVFNALLKDCTVKFPGNVAKNELYLLTVKTKNGTRTPLTDKKGNKLRQIMLIPYIASLCKTYWGEKLANIIMFPFWESQVQQNITFTKCKRELERIIVEANGRPVINVGSPIGQVSILYANYSIECEIKGTDNRIKRQKCPVVLIDVSSPIAVRNAMTNVLKEKFNNVGYVLYRNLDKNNPAVVLSKGQNIPVKEWEAVVNELLRRDGSADSRKRVGAWHKVTDRHDLLETYILNGNSAHLYVQRVKRTSKGFVKLLNDVHK